MAQDIWHFYLFTWANLSPSRHFERAVHLLRVTQGSVDEISGAVGYVDGSTLRTLLRRRLRAGVRELRGVGSRGRRASA